MVEIFNTNYCTNILLLLLIFVIIRRLPNPTRFLLFPKFTVEIVKRWVKVKKRKFMARVKDLAFRRLI